MSQGHPSSLPTALPTWGSTSIPQQHEQDNIQFPSQQPTGLLSTGSRGPGVSIASLAQPALSLPPGVPTHPSLTTRPVGLPTRPGQTIVPSPLGSIGGPTATVVPFSDHHQRSQDGHPPQPASFAPTTAFPTTPISSTSSASTHSSVMPRPLVPNQGAAAGGLGWVPPTPLPKVPLSKPPPSIQVSPVTKIRKRHKVAKSCDGCRQNKRRCDNEMPCSNCRRRNYDCTYTSAQLSRSTWGDTPLSPEKVLGSKALNMTGTVANSAAPHSQSSVPAATTAAGPSAPVPILPAVRPILPAEPSRALSSASRGVLQDLSQSPIKKESHADTSSSGRPYSQSLANRGAGGGAYAAGSDGSTSQGGRESAVGARSIRAAQMARVAPMTVVPSGSSFFSSETPDPRAADKKVNSGSSTPIPKSSIPLATSTTAPAAPSSVHVSATKDNHHGTTTTTNPQDPPSESRKVQEKSRSLRFRKIAADILSLREYDGAMYLPRHIGRSRGRFWAPPTPPFDDADQIPLRHLNPHNHPAQIPLNLKLLPRDAEYLIHVYFKFSYYYAPIINKSVALMHLFEPDKQAHNYFLLNILFMGACKHLGRRQDIQRAIEFRDRARALEKIADPWVLSRIQANAMGSTMTYGVFFGPRSYMEHVGAHRITTKDRGHVHPRTLLPTRGSISEASYQSRLWLFWTIYMRDCVNRLYWGWPCSTDPCSMRAELPEIEGCVGLGGTLVRSPGLTNRGGGGGGGSGLPAPVSASATNKRGGPSSSTSSFVPIAPKPKSSEVDRGPLFMQPQSALGKKRENEMESRRKEASSGKRQHRTAPGASKGSSSDRQAWRGRSKSSDEDEDDDEEADSREAERALPTRYQQHATKRPARPYDMLDLQSKGEILVDDTQGTLIPSVLSESEEFEIKPGQLQEHLDRMEYLLNAEGDVTDDGTYVRAIFLQEIKLWIIGNRVAFYLASDRAVRPKYPTVPFGERQSDVIAATMESGRYSERAWVMDRELQNLQAELMQWERELPDHMRFRMDYEQPDVDHRVNGSLAILTMHYYTITLMLQSAWLPTPLTKETESVEGKALSSPTTSIPRASSAETTTESTGDSPRHSDISSPVSSPSTPSNSLYSPSLSMKSSSSKPRKQVFQPAFLNTAHEICTELSHVLLRQIDICLSRYPEWCRIQAKVNHCIMVALRVCSINAHMITNDAKTRSEAKGGFAAGSLYQKQLAMLPEPLTVRDRPQSEDIRIMEELESDFAKLGILRENMDFLNEAMEESDDADDETALIDGSLGGVAPDTAGNGGSDKNGGLSTSDQLPSSVVDQDPVAQLETLYSEHFPEIYLKDHLEFGISHEGFGYDFDYEDEWG